MTNLAWGGNKMEQFLWLPIPLESSKMKHLFTFVLLISALSSFSQIPAIQWQKSYGGKYGDIANVIRQTTDGGYIVAGYTSSNDGDVIGFSGGEWGAGTGNSDCWVFRIDASGEFKWGKCLGASWIDEATDVRQTSDGGFAIAGWGNCGVCPYAYYLYKLDGGGKLKWTKFYGGTQEYASSMHQTKDGGFILTGTSYSISGQVTGHHGDATTSDFWVVKTDTVGDIQWQKSYGGSANETATTITPTNDGGYILAGHSQSNDGDVTGHHGTSCLFNGYCNDIWIVKIDSDGNIQWQKSLGGTDEDEAADVQQTTDGGYIVAGSVKSNDGDVIGTHPGPVIATNDYWLVKLDNSGSIQWQKTYGGTADDVAHSVIQTSDGGYIVAGKSLSSNGDVTGLHGNFDYWLVKTDNKGKLIWEKCYGGSLPEEAFCIQQTSDNGFVLAGSSFSPVGGDITQALGGSDVWIVKVAGGATEIANEASENNFYIYPNPAENKLFVNNSSLKGGELMITDMLGCRLIDSQFGPNNVKTSVNISGLPSGVYLVIIKSDHGKSTVEKLIKK
jgi:hypothetical protein